MKKAYVILINWNGWADTVECLESLFRSVGVHFRVIVCDNESADRSVERIGLWADGLLDLLAPAAGPLRSLFHPPMAKPVRWVEYSRAEAERGGDFDLDPPLVLIRTGGNLGFAGGNNVGLRYVLARGDFDYVWLLNNDTVVDPGALAALVGRMAEKPSAGMCGSTLLHYETPQRVQARGGGWYCKWIGLPWHLGRLQRVSDPPRRERVERWMNYVVGASMLVSHEFLATVGLMSEDYFLYFEETDWALRSRGRFALAYAPDSRVYHKIGRSIGTSSDPRRKSVTCDFYALRNRLLFTRRFYPEALPTVYLSVLAAALVRLLLGRWRRAWLALGLLLGRETEIGLRIPVRP
jgi:hypothetical protein